MFRFKKDYVYFSSTIILFHQYLSIVEKFGGVWVDDKVHGKRLVAFYDNDRAIETLKILSQLDYCLDCYNHLHDQWTKCSKLFMTTNEATESEKGYDLTFRMQFYCERFYEIAHRLVSMVRKRTKDRTFPLPGLENLSFDNVTIVRNHLLVHPENDDHPIFTQSFIIGGPEGPRIKAFPLNAKFQDNGLYVNAESVRTEIERKLKKFIDTTQNKPENSESKPLPVSDNSIKC